MCASVSLIAAIPYYLRRFEKGCMSAKYKYLRSYVYFKYIITNPATRLLILPVCIQDVQCWNFIMDPGYPNIYRDFARYFHGTLKYSTTDQDTMEEHVARRQEKRCV